METEERVNRKPRPESDRRIPGIVELVKLYSQKKTPLRDKKIKVILDYFEAKREESRLKKEKIKRDKER